MSQLPFFTHKLKNGLTIFAELNERAHSFAAGLFVKTGSRDESPEIAGVSHFLEHMMFKGSSRYSWEDVNRIFDEMGARYNAFTSQEMTAYYANVLPEFGEGTVEHLSELLRPAIRQSDFDTEKNVILEEIAMYLDDPGHRLYERLMEEHFSGHPLAVSVLGTQKTIADLTRDQMAAYFERRYGPGNTVLSVAGRFDFEQVVKWAEKYCGHWKPQHAPRLLPEPKPVNKAINISDGKLSRAYTMALAPGPSAQDERRFAARVLGEVVGDAEGSRFYWALVDNAIAEDAELGFYPHDGCGSFYISITSDPDRSEKALGIALEELKKLPNDLKDDEVQRAKNKLASSIVLQGELPMGRMRAMGSQWAYSGAYRSLDDDMQSLKGVSTDSIRKLLSDFTFDPMTVVTLRP